MIDHDKIIEVMARALFQKFRIEEADAPSVTWEEHAIHADHHAAYVDAATAALTALQASGMAVVGWQPIESAPKDGTHVMESVSPRSIGGGRSP